MSGTQFLLWYTELHTISMKYSYSKNKYAIVVIRYSYKIIDI